jgi:hypothetical protein
VNLRNIITAPPPLPNRAGAPRMGY